MIFACTETPESAWSPNKTLSKGLLIIYGCKVLIRVNNITQPATACILVINVTTM